MKNRFLVIGIFVMGFVLPAMGQESNFAGKGSTNIDSELSPTYALDFMGGLFFHTILPLTIWATVVSALFLGPHLFLKRKNIPSKPYLSLILAGLLLYFGIPYLISSLEALTMIFSQPDQMRTWVFDIRFVLLLTPIIILSIAVSIFYKSSVIRMLIRK